jgi:hypothetical protein
MNVEQILELIRANYDAELAASDSAIVAQVTEFNANEDLRQYVDRCLTVDGYAASGVHVAGVQRMLDENNDGAAPGFALFPRGYVTVATSVGGNAICVYRDGTVWWADHSAFFDDVVSWRDNAGRWREEPATEQSIRRALKPLSDNFEPFLVQLLRDRSPLLSTRSTSYRNTREIIRKY